MLVDALRRIAAVSRSIGIAAALVQAKDENARRFYMACAEFIEYPEDSRTLFLPVETGRGVRVTFGENGRRGRISPLVALRTTPPPTSWGRGTQVLKRPGCLLSMPGSSCFACRDNLDDEVQKRLDLRRNHVRGVMIDMQRKCLVGPVG